MKDLISRNALCEFANNTKDKTIDANDIMRFPSVEKTGKWIDGWRSGLDGTRYWYRACSECGYERDDDDAEKDTNYCPNCGARMEVEHEIN